MRRVDRAMVCKPLGAIRAEEKSNVTYSARCMSGAENARELRELNES